MIDVVQAVVTDPYGQLSVLAGVVLSLALVKLGWWPL